MTAIEDLQTPAVLVDLDVLERNVGRMASAARAAGVKLRPHAKTHKLLELARLQVVAGASGLTVAKTSEAEVFAAEGFEDLFVAYPVVGRGKPERLLSLSDRASLAVGVDSFEGARALASVFAAAGRRLDVLLKVDCGTGRVGVLPEAAPPLALRIAELPGLALRGLFTHAGHVYLETSPEGVASVGRRGRRSRASRTGCGPPEFPWRKFLSGRPPPPARRCRSTA